LNGSLELCPLCNGAGIYKGVKMTTRHLMFKNDVVVEVFPVDNNLYDFSIYTDINREKVESDYGAYEDILFRLKILPLGFYTRSEIGQVLREVREVTNETD
jgi:hypothetical protein|tara:strand:+ start:161 stop:463 length:303 start_codon:yes stop_codon:yes gene_type:complete